MSGRCRQGDLFENMSKISILPCPCLKGEVGCYFSNRPYGECNVALMPIHVRIKADAPRGLSSKYTGTTFGFVSLVFIL
jgi:hypothetical protein